MRRGGLFRARRRYILQTNRNGREAVFRMLAASGLGTAKLAGAAGEAPRRSKRAESFLGIHFDFHAGPDCTEVGKNTTPEMIGGIIDLVDPDYLPCDCKGHLGYTSYPTKVGNPAPGFVGDPLRVWRDATAQRGVALYLRYSGVIDIHAVPANPDWGAGPGTGIRLPRGQAAAHRACRRHPRGNSYRLAAATNSSAEWRGLRARSPTSKSRRFPSQTFCRLRGETPASTP